MHRWQIRHVSLDAPLDPIPALDDFAGAYVVFWLAGVPLGHAYLHRERLPMGAAELKTVAVKEIAPAVAAHLASLDSETPFLDAAAGDRPVARLARQFASEAIGDQPSVSVVVCTRERPEPLRRCLAALQALEPAADEIIVVDNAPVSDEVRSVVDSHAGVRYVGEPRPGLDVARNAGARAATREIIAYTDDDVEVHPKWIRGIHHGFSSGDVASVAGLVLPAELESEAQYLFEQHWSFGRGFLPIVYDPDYFARHKRLGAPAWEIGAGANMAFRREVFATIGGFDERLDVGAAGCSGDSEFWYRMLAAGMTIRYEPSAVVSHHHRDELSALRKQLFAYMRGHACALLVQNEHTPRSGNLVRLALGLPFHFARSAAAGMPRLFKGRHRFLVTEIAGFLAGIQYYAATRKRTGASVFGLARHLEEAA